MNIAPPTIANPSPTSTAGNELQQGIQNIQNQVVNAVSGVKNNIQELGDKIEEKVNDMVPEKVTNVVDNIKEKTNDVNISIPPFLNNVGSFRKNVMKMAIAVFLLFNVVLFIMFKMGDKTMDFFKNPAACPEGYTLNEDGDCVNTSAVTGCKTFNHDRKPKQIRQWIDTCNLIWDGYSNNPDFMNDPVGL